MKAFLTAFISLAWDFVLVWLRAADDFAARAWQMESKGDAAEARDYLQHAAQTGGADAKLAYAQFLDRHRDPAAREAYEKVWDAARGEQRELAARRIVVLDLIAGDRDAAQRDVEQYRSAGGRDFNLPPAFRDFPRKAADHRHPGPAAFLRAHGRAGARNQPRRRAARPGAQCGHQRLSSRRQ